MEKVIAKQNMMHQRKDELTFKTSQVGMPCSAANMPKSMMYIFLPWQASISLSALDQIGTAADETSATKTNHSVFMSRM